MSVREVWAMDTFRTALTPFLNLEESRRVHSVTKARGVPESVVDYISDAEIQSINAKGETLLHRAVQSGIGARDTLNIIKINFEHFKNADRFGNTALHRAVMSYAKHETLVCLIEKYPESVDTLNDEGFSPLHLMVRAHVYQMGLERDSDEHSMQTFREQVSTDKNFYENTVTEFRSFLQRHPDNPHHGSQMWFSMYDTLQFLLQVHTLSFCTRDKTGNTVLHYCVNSLEFDEIYMQVPGRCPSCCVLENEEGNTVLDLIVSVVNEDNLTENTYSEVSCMPLAYSHRLTTGEKVILLSKNILLACPDLLHRHFLRDDSTGSWDSILGACRECDGMAFFLVTMCNDLLFEKDSDGEMAFREMDILGIRNHSEPNYVDMAEKDVLKNKDKIIKTYLKAAQSFDRIQRERLNKRCA